MHAEPRHIELAQFIEEHRNEILDGWASYRRSDEKTARLSHRELMDHLPYLLSVIAEAIGESRGEPPEVTELEAGKHALQRLDIGFELADVVEEYAILRRVLFQVLRRHQPELIVEGFEVLEMAIDRSIAQSVTRYTEVRQRTLSALDRVSEISLGTDDVEALLPKLLEVLVQTAPSVDSAAILLREGDVLRVRAAVGLIASRDTGFSLRLGEGFSGMVAQTRRPLLIKSASTDPLIKSEFIRQRGVRALYGVPLLRGGEVMGVAHMGSVTAYDFSEDDRLLFRTTAERSAMLIVQAEQRTALKKAAEFRDQIIALASHDLRNPLASIRLVTDRLLRREELPEPVVRAAQRIAASAARMEAILSGLLDYTQTRFTGALLLRREPANMEAIARQAVEELELAHPQRTIQLEVEGDVEGCWDSKRLGQVVSNLVGNALLHGDPTSRIEVAVRGHAEEVELEVSNQGPPIPAGLLPHLFEPFRRGTTEAGRSTAQGFGLGLYIVQEIVHAHGGQVSVRSEASGTTFTVRIPRQIPKSSAS